MVLAGGQLRPEGGVVLRPGFLRRHEQPMVMADDLVEPIAHRIEEKPVRIQHGAIQRELDHRLRCVDREDLPPVVGRALDPVGDVVGELHDLRDPALAVLEDGIEGLDPVQRAILVQAQPLDAGRLAVEHAAPLARGALREAVHGRAQAGEIDAHDVLGFIAVLPQEPVVGPYDASGWVHHQGRETAVERPQFFRRMHHQRPVARRRQRTVERGRGSGWREGEVHGDPGCVGRGRFSLDLRHWRVDLERLSTLPTPIR